MSLATLNSSGIQQSNPALYQTIKDLYDQNLALTNLIASYGFTYNKDNNQLTEDNALILNQTLSVGQLLTLVNGQVKFPAIQNPSTNANTLDDYEEGTWTPVDVSGAGLIFTYPIVAQYIKIGQLVMITGGVTFPVTASGAGIEIGGLPFINQATTQYAAPVLFTTVGFLPMGFINLGSTEVNYFNPATGAIITNAVMSGQQIRFSASYRTTS